MVRAKGFIDLERVNVEVEVFASALQGSMSNPDVKERRRRRIGGKERSLSPKPPTRNPREAL